MARLEHPVAAAARPSSQTAWKAKAPAALHSRLAMSIAAFIQLNRVSANGARWWFRATPPSPPTLLPLRASRSSMSPPPLSPIMSQLVAPRLLTLQQLVAPRLKSGADDTRSAGVAQSLFPVIQCVANILAPPWRISGLSQSNRAPPLRSLNLLSLSTLSESPPNILAPPGRVRDS